MPVSATPEPGAPPQYFQVTSTAAALNQYAAAAAAASAHQQHSQQPHPQQQQQQQPGGHAPPLFPMPGQGEHASATPPIEIAPAAGTTVAPPVRPKRYFCRRCYPHLHFSSELDKKRHIDEYHDGRARDRVFPTASGGPTPPGAAEAKRKERPADGGADSLRGGTPEGSSANGEVKPPVKKRYKLEHAHPLAAGVEGDYGGEGTAGGQHAYGAGTPAAAYATMSQHELDQRTQYGGALSYGAYGPDGGSPCAHPPPAAYPQQQQLGLPPMSSMMPPPPHPSRHHSHSSGTMPPPPAPSASYPSGPSTTTAAAAAGARRKSRAAPEKVAAVALEFPCLFCVVEPACDFETRAELEAHVLEVHDWRAADRLARERREVLEVAAAAAEGAQEAQAEQAKSDAVGWCEMCVPRIAFGDAAARDWHWKVAHQRLKGPPPGEFQSCATLAVVLLRHLSLPSPAFCCSATHAAPGACRRASGRACCRRPCISIGSTPRHACAAHCAVAAPQLAPPFAVRPPVVLCPAAAAANTHDAELRAHTERVAPRAVGQPRPVAVVRAAQAAHVGPAQPDDGRDADVHGVRLALANTGGVPPAAHGRRRAASVGASVARRRAHSAQGAPRRRQPRHVEGPGPGRLSAVRRPSSDHALWRLRLPSRPHSALPLPLLLCDATPCAPPCDPADDAYTLAPLLFPAPARRSPCTTPPPRPASHVRRLSHHVPCPSSTKPICMIHVPTPSATPSLPAALEDEQRCAGSRPARWREELVSRPRPNAGET